MKCKYEGSGVWEGRCTGTKEVDPCPGYDKCKNYKPCCMTNADHVRAMSDEELAEDRVYSYTHGNMEVWCGDFYGWEYTKEAAIERELEWLKQPYKEDA